MDTHSINGYDASGNLLDQDEFSSLKDAQTAARSAVDMLPGSYIVILNASLVEVDVVKF